MVRFAAFLLLLCHFGTTLWAQTLQDSLRFSFQEYWASGAAATLAYSPDGRFLAHAAGDATLRLWHLAGPPVLTALRGHPHTLTAMAYSPDGNTLASGSYEGTTRLWDVAAAQPRPLPVDSFPFCQYLAFSPDGTKLAGILDSSVGVLHLATGQIHRYDISMLGRANALAYSPDGAMLAVATDNLTVLLLRGETGTEMGRLRIPASICCRLSAVAFSPDGTLLAVGSQNSNLYLWDMKTQTLQHTFSGEENYIKALTFSPDGRLLASGSQDMYAPLKVYDVHRRSQVPGFRFPSFDILPDSIRLPVTVTALVFSPDGHWLVTGLDPLGVLTFWEVANGQPKVHALALQPEDNWAVMDHEYRYDGSP